MRSSYPDYFFECDNPFCNSVSYFRNVADARRNGWLCRRKVFKKGDYGVWFCYCPSCRSTFDLRKH